MTAQWHHFLGMDPHADPFPSSHARVDSSTSLFHDRRGANQDLMAGSIQNCPDSEVQATMAKNAAQFRRLKAAIDELVQFVLDHRASHLTQEELNQLDELDGTIVGMATHLDLPLPTVPSQPNRDIRYRGQLGIPHYWSRQVSHTTQENPFYPNLVANSG